MEDHMKRRMERRLPARQRGWIGLIVMLLAVVIVGILAKNALQQYGLTGSAAPATKGMPIDAAAPDATTVVPTPRSALERARGVESSVQQQAEDLSKRIDAATKSP
jgi:TRAP-type C4-dicarboxylate transport system permease small subunit